MTKLIEKLISDPNSPFNESDRKELSKLDPATLKRLAIGISSAEVSVSNVDLIASMQADLSECQKDLVELIETEHAIRQELEGHGVASSSVLKQFVSVHNQAPQSSELSEKEVMDYVHKSSSVTAMVLREALAAREQSRKHSIETIVHNSNGMYTVEELKQKFTP